MSEIIAIQGRVAIAAGLDWVRLAQASQRSPREQHRQQRHDIRTQMQAANADRFLVHTQHHPGTATTTLGLYQSDGMEQEHGKRVFALALLAQCMKAGQADDTTLTVMQNQTHEPAMDAIAAPENRLLAWHLDDGRVAVVIVMDGIPVADTVTTENDAHDVIGRALAGAFGPGTMHLISNQDSLIAPFLGHLVQPGLAHIIDLPMLLEATRQSVPLQTSPLPLARLAGSILLVVLLLCLLLVSNHLLGQQAARAQAAKQAALDPLPAYRTLLAGHLMHLGVAPGDWIDLIQQLHTHKTWRSGWRLHRAVCQINQCRFTFGREGGLISPLLAQLPNGQLAPDSRIDTAIVVQSAALSETGVIHPTSLPHLHDATLIDWDVLQTWRNSGVVLQGELSRSSFAIWPQAHQGDTRRLTGKDTVVAAPVQLTAPFALAEEVMHSTPKGWYWQSLTLELGEGAPESRLNVTLQGWIYAQND